MTKHIFRLPDLGEGIAEAELVAWCVTVGDTIIVDQPVAEVMTDKATVEVPSPVGGMVSWLAGEPGEMIAVGGELLHIETDSESTAILKGGSATAVKAGAFATSTLGELSTG